MSRSLLGLLLVALTAPLGHAGPLPRALVLRDGGAGNPGFHLEGKPVIDDVFGDSADYRRTVDRFLELTTRMQALRNQFASSVQDALAALGSRPGSSTHLHAHHCPTAELAVPYARARHLGAEYLRIGRELTRHYEVVKELDRLGETVGLTPDYRWKVRRVLAQYDALLTDYREMKLEFHDELLSELHYAGCNLNLLIARGDPRAKSALGNDDSWPPPGTPGAPGVTLARMEGPREAPPALPAERVPPQQPIALPRHNSSTVPAPPDDSTPRSGVLFYVDNTRCPHGTTVYLDGKRLGEVAPATRVGFQTSPGPHDLCLLDDPKKACGAPGTVRRSYLHEGWTISLRCE